MNTKMLQDLMEGMEADLETCSEQDRRPLKALLD